MKLSEVIEKYGECDVSEELLKTIETKWERKPKIGEKYFYICCGEVFSTVWENENSDLFCLGKRNVYQTEEEAQFALDMYNFCNERSFEPDWEVENSKWHVSLNYHVNEAYVAECILDDRGCPFYYKSREAVQEIIDKYTFEELAKYYGRV